MRRGRQWIDDAASAKEPCNDLNLTAEPSGGSEHLGTVTKLVDVCRSCPAPSTTPSVVDVLKARKWTQQAECAKPANSNLTWISEKSGGIEHPGTVGKLFRICAACPVRRECLEDALGASFTAIGIWGGTTMTERTAAMAQVAKEMAAAAAPITRTNYMGSSRRASWRPQRSTGSGRTRWLGRSRTVSGAGGTAARRSRCWRRCWRPGRVGRTWGRRRTAACPRPQRRGTSSAGARRSGRAA